MKPGVSKQLRKKNKRRPKNSKTRNWLDLPRDVMLHIFLKLGVIDLLYNAQSVCSSWRKLAKEPQLFRRIDFSNPWTHFDECNREPPIRMVIEAIDRSCGQLVDFSLTYFGTDDVLQYIVDTSNSLRALRLATCSEISEDLLIEALKKFALLEEFQLSLCSFTKEVIEVAGRWCPELKSFRLNQQAEVYPGSDFLAEFNEEAFAIAANMPKLRRLHLFGNMMNDNGLKVILEKCLHLEYLDLRHCFHIDNGLKVIPEKCQELEYLDFRKKIDGIKEIRFPYDSTEGYEFDAIVHYGGSYDNDYASEYDDYIDGMSDLDISDDDGIGYYDGSDGNEFDFYDGIGFDL